MGNVTNGYNQNQFPANNGYGVPSYPQPMQNQPWSQPPQMMQQPFPMPQQAPSLPGRVVQNPNDIRPNEVAMDGNVTYFPMSDYSCIFAKQWKADGTIETVRYVPEAASAPSTKDNGIKDQLDRIERMLKQRNNHHKPYNRKEEQAENNGK